MTRVRLQVGSKHRCNSSQNLGPRPDHSRIQCKQYANLKAILQAGK
jgi:hypothetical protein